MFEDKIRTIEVIDGQGYLWSVEKIDDINIYSKGGMWIENEYLPAKLVSKRLADLSLELENKLSDPNLVLHLKNVFNSIYGHFAFIIDSPRFTVAVVDKIRSHPIFYLKNNEALIVSCSAQAIRSTMSLVDMEESSVIEFLMAGYVSKGRTLFKRLKQLRAGEFLVLKKQTNRLLVERYYSYYPQRIDQREEKELLEVHHDLIKNVFSKMVETLNGRKVWIPLSGGLDSRLVLAALLEAKYDNVGTFTYGIPQLWEVKWAENCAKYVGVEWHFIEYDRKKLARVCDTSMRSKYFQFASGLSSVPFFADLCAVSELRNKKLLRHDSIIINGQSGDFISGGHLPKILESVHEQYISLEGIVHLLIEKHYSLWTNLKTSENIKFIKQNILDSIGRNSKSRSTKPEAGQLYELYEWQERQSKYVVNGQRMYEWFGNEWRLPLWSDELLLFWQNIPFDLKIGQRLYKKYLVKLNPGGLFNREMPKKQMYFPMMFRPAYTFLLVAAKLGKTDPKVFLRKYVDYYWVYSPFYQQKSYFEYLKDSAFHRNHVSYYAKEVLSLLRYQ